MKKKSVVVLLTVTMVIEMTAAGCGDKQLALATDRVSVELGYELNTDVAAYVADADIAVETTIDFGAVDVSKLELIRQWLLIRIRQRPLKWT